MRHKEACLRITCLTVCKDLLWAGTSAGAIVTVAIPRVTLNSTKQTMEPPQLEVLKQGHIGHVRFLVSLESVADSDTNTVPEGPRVSLSPKPEPTATKFQYGKKDSTNDFLSTSSTTEKTDSSSESRPLNMTDDRRFAQPESVLSSQPIRSPHPPPRPKPPNLSHLQQATKSEPTVTSDSTSSDVITPLENRLSISPSHRHYLLGIRRASVNPCTTIATQMKVISGGEGLEEYNTSEVTTSTPEVTSNENLGDNDSTNQILIWDVH
ncbi:unnamed protein product [Echinostoma caproni]|uniref:Rho guanine nucleotide exchange factor 26 n=1 Tax=Echinostoma caproni TaxID=27848 RepID=A0A183BB15_9TREM|nr:unnamed protein product [Echinostoma caproni]